MQVIDVSWGDDVAEKFPELRICMGKRARAGEVRAKQKVEALKDNPIVRAYRDFYWKLDIDPTKTRPSGEALLRRVLNGNELPSISAVVDAYDLASMETIISISGFEMDCLKPPLHVRFARNEAFTGIGMDKPMFLTEKTLVLTDEKEVLCVYPYRDSDYTKITLQTQNAVIVGYGVPEIGRDDLNGTVEKTLGYIRSVSGGEVEWVKVYGIFEEGVVSG